MPGTDGDDIAVFSGAVKCPPSGSNAGANWVPKFCSLTQRSLCLKERAADLACTDRIPLRDVEEVVGRDYAGQLLVL